MPSPSRKSKKDLTLPPGSLTLTLIGMSKSWDSRKHLMRRVYKSNQILNEGTCLSCCERFGGNTLQCKWCNHLYVSMILRDDCVSFFKNTPLQNGSTFVARFQV